MIIVNDGYDYIVAEAEHVSRPSDIGSHEQSRSARLYDPHDIEKIVRIQNRTAHSVFVTGCDGVTFEVKAPLHAAHCDNIWVMVSYRGPVEVVRKTFESLQRRHGRDKHYRPWLNALKSPAVDVIDKRHGMVTAQVQYRLTDRQKMEIESKFPDKHYRFYMPDVDLVFEWKNPTLPEDVPLRHMPHPHCKAKREADALKQVLPPMGSTTQAMTFRAVDNSLSGVRDSRYINLGGDVYEIPAERSTGMADGIYVTSRHPVEFGEDTRLPLAERQEQLAETKQAFTTVHYSFEEAEKKFYLSRSAEDAKEGGPLLERMKAETARIAQESKLEIEKIRRERMDKEKVLNEELDKLKREQSEWDRSASKAKAGDTWVKVLTGIFTGVLALITTVLKYKAAK